MTVAILIIVCVIAAVILIGKKNTDSTPTPSPAPQPDLTNNPPIIFHPSRPRTQTAYLINNELLVFDYRHRKRGCDTAGNAMDEVGAYDPEGGMLEFRTEASLRLEGGGIVKYPIFSMSSKAPIDGDWLEPGTEDLPISVKNSITGEKEPLSVFGLVIGHTTDDTPLLVRNVDVNATIVSAKACGCNPTPQPQPEEPTSERLGVLTVTTTVRDPKGLVAADSFAYEVYRGCR